VVAQRAFDVLLAFPALIFAIGLTAVTGPGLVPIGCVVVAVGLPLFGRLVRSATLRARELPFVEVAEVMGASRGWVLRRHILPNIAEPLVVQLALSMSGDRDRSWQVRDLLDSVALPQSYAERLPRQLSGGQRQRVALARALALEPQLLVADEPTSALDVSVQAVVLELFGDLQQRRGFACLFISHALAVVNNVADRVAVLQGGRLVEQGPANQVLMSPTEDYTRRLVEAIPVPDPVAQRARRAATERLRKSA
jgi:ABC-type methionine transport system ATPase subunit